MNSTDQKPWIFRYHLRARGFLNSISSRRSFEGALIRMGSGFGCIHPWPELGDPPLETCLADLHGPRLRAIVRRAVRCTIYDGAARENEESLFDEHTVPRSHATLRGIDPKEAEGAVAAGFTIAKVKIGRNLERETAELRRLHQAFPQLRLRVDFNESCDAGQVRSWVAELSDSLRGAIDFLEDPCPFSEVAWKNLRQETGMRLAVDREAGPNRVRAQVQVIKPALDEPFLIGEAAAQNGQQVVVTSAMDHPLGQAFAAWEAARLELMFPGLVGICGLQTHHLFSADSFADALGGWAPDFQVPDGTGLGFDELLEALPWTRFS